MYLIVSTKTLCNQDIRRRKVDLIILYIAQVLTLISMSFQVLFSKKMLIQAIFHRRLIKLEIK
jgi:hypothetical protein